MFWLLNRGMIRMEIREAFVFLLCFLGVAISQETSGFDLAPREYNDSQTRLANYLFKNYNKMVRPVLNYTETINIELYIYFGQLINLDEVDQTMVSRLGFYMTWKNELLTWNISDFDGLPYLVVPLSKIWVPELRFWDSSDDRKPSMVMDDKVEIVLMSDGTCMWDQQPIVECGCDIDVTHFPFDNQTCQLRFGTTVYGVQQLNYTLWDNRRAKLHFMDNSLWFMDSFPCKKDEGTYFQLIVCELKISRKSLYYMYNLVMPCSIILVIGALCFCLPVESGEKVGLSVTVLLAMTVFMILVMEELPINSDHIPYIEKFIGGSMVVLAFSALMAVIVLAFHYQADNPLGQRLPPHWMVAFCFGPLAKVMFVNTRILKKKYEKVKASKGNTSVALISKNDTENLAADNGNTKPSPEVEDDDEEIYKMTSHVWFGLAYVVDRLFFILYALVCFVMILALLIKSAQYDPDLYPDPED